LKHLFPWQQSQKRGTQTRAVPNIRFVLALMLNNVPKGLFIFGQIVPDPYFCATVSTRICKRCCGVNGKPVVHLQKL